MARLASAPSLSTAAAARVRPRWWREILLLLALYLVYDGIRLVVSAGHKAAFVDAGRVISFERTIGIAHETGFNHAVSAWPVLAVVMAYSYATLHYVVTPLVLIWLWRMRPAHYTDARSALVVATLLGLLGFWLFPTAPPRVMPGYVDTLAEYARWGWWGGSASAPKGLGGLTNEFAAMPSLHVGWAVWCGWQVARTTRHRVVQALGVGYPLWIIAVVIGTANHYIADVAAGIVVIAIGVVLVWAAHGVLAFRSRERTGSRNPLPS